MLKRILLETCDLVIEGSGHLRADKELKRSIGPIGNTNTYQHPSQENAPMITILIVMITVVIVAIIIMIVMMRMILRMRSCAKADSAKLPHSCSLGTWTTHATSARDDDDDDGGDDGDDGDDDGDDGDDDGDK